MSPQEESKDRWLARVAKLLNMAAGAKAVGNQHEAEAFAAKVQELLVEHALSMTEVEAAQSAADDPIDETRTAPLRNGRVEYRSALEWQRMLAEAIVHSYGGHLLTLYGSSALIFVGRASTRPVMVYVYETLVTVARRLMRRARKEAREQGVWQSGYDGSYMVGFARAIRERLLAERRAMEDRVHAQAKAERRDDAVSTALVRIGAEPQRAREWAQAKYFPPPPPPSAEELAEREEAKARSREWWAAQEAEEAARLAAETPAARAARRERERAQTQRERSRQYKEEEREREREWRQASRRVGQAAERGYEDGKAVQITKGVGTPAPGKGRRLA